MADHDCLLLRNPAGILLDLWEFEKEGQTASVSVTGRLCSNDPVCAQHEPANPHERRFLHGAACHGCVLVAETSCERRNEWLDRALVVPTVQSGTAAFFGDG